jgi:hypothetical protein
MPRSELLVESYSTGRCETQLKAFAMLYSVAVAADRSHVHVKLGGRRFSLKILV